MKTSNPIVRLKKLGKYSKLLNINDLAQQSIKVSEFSKCRFYSAILRFELKSKLPRFSIYKFMVLIDSDIYLYTKFYNRSLDLDRYSSVISFEDDRDARNAWTKYVGNPIEINYAD